MQNDETLLRLPTLSEIINLLQGLSPYINPLNEVYCRIPTADGRGRSTEIGSSQLYDYLAATFYDRGQQVSDRLVTSAIRIVRGRLRHQTETNTTHTILLDAIVELTREEQEWTGSAQRLFDKLERLESTTQIKQRFGHLWPTSAVCLGMRLAQLIDEAKSRGVLIQRPPRLASTRLWHLQLLSDMPDTRDTSDTSVTAANTSDFYDINDTMTGCRELTLVEMLP